MTLELREVASLDEVQDLVDRECWGDGLPVIPPTPERVDRMLASTDLGPDEVLAHLPPQMGPATVRKVAINAVLAGCRPEHFPVVLAAVRALASPELNLLAIQVTTGPAGPLVLVNGPVAGELGMNSGAGALGPGNRANATIGRAVRLVLLNIGGAIPGAVDMATIGQPGKYTACLAENEAQNPWQPLHVERGFDPATSAVTVFAVEAPINVNDIAARSAHSMLRIAATNMSIIGPALYFRTEPLLALSPEHARLIAGDGWSKDDVKRYLYETARLHVDRLSPDDVTDRLVKRWPKKYSERGENQWVTIADRWEDIVVIVAGGSGRHSVFLPPGGMSRSVTVPLTRRDGTVISSVRELERGGGS